MIKLEIKNLPNGVNYTKDDTGGSAQMQIDAVPRGTPLWVSGRTIKNPGKTQTITGELGGKSRDCVVMETKEEAWWCFQFLKKSKSDTLRIE